MNYESIGVDPLEMDLEPMAMVLTSNNNNNNNNTHKQKEDPVTKSPAAKCPHCHREFTNLRHHINQQHMQVSYLYILFQNQPIFLHRYHIDNMQKINSIRIKIFVP